MNSITIIYPEKFFDIMEKACRSSKDGRLFFRLFDLANANNEIIIPTLKRFAEINGCSISTLKRLLKRLEEANFLDKVASRHYKVNPYMYMSSALAMLGEQAMGKKQQEWKKPKDVH